ncbi:DNA polymerase III subunit gamma and tau [Herbiconiux sp. YIM B11900]|uniref:DNA polymerase III subunit gamma and tau n=1 Tax=Herbiconiux sp. YIM B11900 TaxID=3404131 RepID=UPI003F8464FC
MSTALYRRYRPENFAEMIGQSQVTDPLMTALRTNRVNHAYLFSGPRGCGKTTSARILARCLNCAEGPTDTPCGVCPSCVELGRDGPGSLDVVEIDAASHNGVDDARDLRERAVFAPARDRFKIFILDEAHMVTPQGFNALLKIVEEPPEHIKFIFATTEPDKVIGTIRSRTHHYPFRLIPPAQLLEYVQSLCDSEGVEVAPGVLPLVVRAGGGSARDTLSLLDQLIAGSEGNRVEYERAVALLGYTHGALLSEAIDALGTHDGAAAFDAVDRVIQTGQDPRRFVEDLLERVRDIIVVEATREQASAVLRGVPADEIEVMRRQAALFGHAELSRLADIVNTALTEMTGATSPRLHLELMVARALVPASDDSQRGALARVERLERRIGVDGPDAGRPVAAAVGSAPAERVAASSPAVPVSSPAPAASAPEPSTPAAAPTASAASAAPASPAGPSTPAESPVETPDVVAVPQAAVPIPAADAAAAAESPAAVSAAAGEVTLQQMKDAWPEILEAVQKAKMTAWLVVYTAQVRALDGDVLTLAFPSENDVASFKERSAPGQGVSEFLRQAILDVLGLRVMYRANVDTSLRPHHDPSPEAPAAPAARQPATSTQPPPSAQATPPAAQGPTPTAGRAAQSRSTSAPSAPSANRAAAPTTSWDVVAIPTSSDDEPPLADEPMPSDEPELPADRADSVPGAGAPAQFSAPAPASAAPAPAAGSSAPQAAAPTTSASTASAAAPVRAPAAPSRPPAATAGGRARYGEAVVREILGANFIEEQPLPGREG